MKKDMPIDQSLQMWIESDRMSLARLQTLTAVEIAAFGGWYLLCKDGHSSVALALMWVATTLSCLLWWLAEYDRQDSRRYRDYYEATYALPERKPVQRGIAGRHLFRAMAIVLLGVNVVLLFAGCSYLLGDVWACKL